jgi:hypothetical protein
VRAARALIGGGAAVLVVAGVVAALSAWLAAGPVGLLRAAGAAPSTVPARVTLDAARVEYVVFARAGAAASAPAPGDVRGESAAGAAVPLTPDRDRFLRHEADEFRSVVRFTPPDDGRYTVVVSGAAGAEVTVVPDVPGAVLARLGAGVVGLVLGVALLLFGLILLVVGLVRRSRAGDHRR